MKKRKTARYNSGFMSLALLDTRLYYALFIAASLVLLSISVLKPTAMEGAKLGAIQAFAPVIETASIPFQEASMALQNVSGIAQMKSEIAMLREENTRLKEWYQTALMLEAENKSLSELLNLRIDPRHSFITSRVISDSNSPYIKSLLIASGTHDGVAKDQAVLSGNGLLGKVVEAGKDYSRVLLLNDFNSRVPVIIEGSRQKAILTGDNTNYPVLKFLPKDANVTEGARIVTSGHGGVFPPGLPVGTVAVDQNGNFIADIFTNIDDVTYVRIVDKPAMTNLLANMP